MSAGAALDKPRVRFPKLASGYKRQWLKCRTCGRVYYRDYVPYSLSNPVMWTPCGHSIGSRDLNCDSITEGDAQPLYIEQQTRAALAAQEARRHG